MRVSVSGIAGLFSGTRLPYQTPTGRKRTGIIKNPKARTPLNDFVKTNIFPHGNVNEHRALEIVKHNYPDTHGQTAFARMIDRSKEFVPDLEPDTKYATRTRQPRSASFPEFRMLQHWKAETEKLKSYTINGVTYDIGRREHKIGNVTLVCQPDGLCESDQTVIEIKCPYGDMYTTENTEKWLKHVVQAALEMLVFKTEKAILVVYLAPRATYQQYSPRTVVARQIVFTKAQLGPLITKLRTFIYRMGEQGSGDDAYQIYTSCESQLNTLFVEIQGLLQKVPLLFEDLPIPQSIQSNSVTVDVVFIGNRTAELIPSAPYRLVAEPANSHDVGAIRVVPAHTLIQLPAPCYVTRNSKKSWLLPILDRIVSCRAVSKYLLELEFSTPHDSSAASGSSGSAPKRRRGSRYLDNVELKF